MRIDLIFVGDPHLDASSSAAMRSRCAVGVSGSRCTTRRAYTTASGARWRTTATACRRSCSSRSCVRPPRAASACSYSPRTGMSCRRCARSTASRAMPGCATRLTMAWNANNTYGFHTIDFHELARAAQLTCVSRYMKFEVAQHGAASAGHSQRYSRTRLLRSERRRCRVHAAHARQPSSAAQGRELRPRQALAASNRRRG